MDRKTDRWIERQIDGQKDRQMDRKTDLWIERQIDGQKNIDTLYYRQLDGQIDRQMDIQITLKQNYPQREPTEHSEAQNDISQRL